MCTSYAPAVIALRVAVNLRFATREAWRITRRNSQKSFYQSKRVFITTLIALLPPLISFDHLRYIPFLYVRIIAYCRKQWRRTTQTFFVLLRNLKLFWYLFKLTMGVKRHFLTIRHLFPICFSFTEIWNWAVCIMTKIWPHHVFNRIIRTFCVIRTLIVIQGIQLPYHVAWKQSK